MVIIINYLEDIKFNCLLQWDEDGIINLLILKPLKILKIYIPKVSKRNLWYSQESVKLKMFILTFVVKIKYIFQQRTIKCNEN